MEKIVRTYHEILRLRPNKTMPPDLSNKQVERIAPQANFGKKFLNKNLAEAGGIAK